MKQTSNNEQEITYRARTSTDIELNQVLYVDKENSCNVILHIISLIKLYKY